MVWPQVSLAQLAAMVHPPHTVAIIDAIATRMSWPQFHDQLLAMRPRLYVTHVTAPTLTNDLYGAFLARALGAWTVAFGTHVTPQTMETMNAFPALDFVLQGEPELTLRELADALAGRGRADVPPAHLQAIPGLAWRRDGQIVINERRPLIDDLDSLPMPLHGLLPLDRYRMPMLRGPYSFVVTSRGCPAACRFCIKHVTYGQTVRLRSPERILEELRELVGLGIHNVHMYADLFTVSREQVMRLCTLLLEEDLRIRWTCNSRVDFVDADMLKLMGRAGCWLISWGIESASDAILRRARKGYRPEQAVRALEWARASGIRNWGYFIIGLPGETEESIHQTVALSKRLPLDLALFHIAAPHPGTPMYEEVVAEGWLRPDVRWEDVDMDRSTVLEYPGLSAGQLERHARRAFRQWALRPRPIWTLLRSMSDLRAARSALQIGLQEIAWMAGHE